MAVPPVANATPLIAAAEGAGVLVAPDNGAKATMMRHGNRVKHLGRPQDQRKALIRGLVTEVIRNGTIRTTKVGAPLGESMRIRDVRDVIWRSLAANGRGGRGGWRRLCTARCSPQRCAARATQPAGGGAPASRQGRRRAGLSYLSYAHAEGIRRQPRFTFAQRQQSSCAARTAARRAARGGWRRGAERQLHGLWLEQLGRSWGLRRERGV